MLDACAGHLRQRMRDPVEDYEKINGELKKFSPLLWRFRELVAANKTDLPESAEHLARFEERPWRGVTFRRRPFRV
ncbi:MAG: hypothetical protein R2881_09780 [Eubacteriales bacterium]